MGFITTYFLYFLLNDEVRAGGVPKELLNRVFEPYFTTKHQSQGTGIGLYMCKEIIEKNMGGVLKVENSTYTYNDIHFKGACFIIELPLS